MLTRLCYQPIKASIAPPKLAEPMSVRAQNINRKIFSEKQENCELSLREQILWDYYFE